jgi:pimeloyl-ACP methyl ester carboxylesterase
MTYSDLELKESFVSVNGLRLHYTDWGGDGPPILILHATGFLGRIYAPIAEKLRAAGRVYTCDQRGHGDSARPADDDIDWFRTADDLEAFIEAMGFQRIRALGHSAGGTAIGAVAARRADLILRSVLVEPVIVDTANPTNDPRHLEERTIKRRRVFDDVQSMFDNFASKPPYNTWRPEILRDYCEHGTRVEDGRRVLKCAPEIEARVYATAREFDGLGTIAAVSSPMLVMFGANSDSPGLSFAERLAAPQRRIIIVPGATHFLPMEQPELVAKMVLQFFSGK